MLLSGALLLSLASCINDNYLDDVQYADGNVTVELNIQTRSLSSIGGTSTEYVPGTEWENYVDLANGDYRIYFFTYNPTSESSNGANSTLIAEFKPTTIYSTDLDTYTTYTLSGEVDESLIESLTNFKVVVVANWGTYPSVIAGTTTIDDICNAQTAVFSAFVDATTGSALMPSSTLHIPFFGLREYSGVKWTAGTMTRLSGDITLLRSLAKVEIILEPNEEQPDITFDDVSIVNYNAQGYCAPTGVYLRGDYDHNYTWEEDFVDGLHLIGNANDADAKSFKFSKTQEKAVDETTGEVTQYDTWTCYLPEYSNTGTDYSYISVMIGNEAYPVYFANYDDEGLTTAYETEGNTEDRYDVYRNYLYRFHVTYVGTGFRVRVNEWEDVFDNEWTFGETSPQLVDSTFTVGGIMYKVIVSQLNEWVGDKANYTLEVETTVGGTYGTDVIIPDTVRYHGFTYSVTEIGDSTFYGEMGIESIYIPSSVDTIGSYAFYECTDLKSLYIDNYSPPICKENAFTGLTTSEVTLYVPYQAIDYEYKEKEPWSNFKSIEAIPGTEPEGGNPVRKKAMKQKQKQRL